MSAPNEGLVRVLTENAAGRLTNAAAQGIVLAAWLQVTLAECLAAWSEADRRLKAEKLTAAPYASATQAEPRPGVIAQWLHEHGVAAPLPWPGVGEAAIAQALEIVAEITEADAAAAKAGLV